MIILKWMKLHEKGCFCATYPRLSDVVCKKKEFLKVMHIRVFRNTCVDALQSMVNEEIRRLESISPIERNFTKIVDVKIGFANENGYIATLIYD